MIALLKKTLLQKWPLAIAFFIFLLACVLRFYRLGGVPVGLHRDEAFLGYNAYSILKTGRDMSGSFLPLHLQSFIYSPAGYAYFSLPFIKIFDLSAFSVRFVSALFGSLTVLVTYFLAKKLLGNSQFSILVSLISSFFLAISPWHINLSRTATENVLVIFFIALGVLSYLEWVERNNWYLLIGSFILFGSTLLIYQAPRAFLPLLAPFTISLFLSKVRDKKKILLPVLLYGLIILIPLFVTLASPNLSLRIRTVSIFGTQETQLTLDEQLREDGVSGVGVFPARIFHNKLIGYTSQFTQNYFKHFSFDFLFTDQGLPIRYKVPGNGLLYLYELPLLLLGVWYLWSKCAKRTALFLVGWILLVPVGSGLTFDDIPNLQRTLLVFPATSIVSAVGLYAIFNFISKFSNFLYPTLILASLIIIYNFSFYLHQYYVHQVRHRPLYRHEGYRDLVAKVNTFLPNYPKAIITDLESAPAIFFLFFGKYSPLEFQRQIADLANTRDLDKVNFSKYVFAPESCPLKAFVEKDPNTGEPYRVVRGKKDILYVNQGFCDDLPEAENMDTIRRSDQTPVFKILRLR